MTPKVFTIPPHRAFADALAAGLIARHGREKTGLARGILLVPNNRAARAIQEAFVQTGGSQCGFCTPGFIISAVGLLQRNPDPSELEIREAISGNVCRCTGYIAIIEAIRRAAAVLRGDAR